MKPINRNYFIAVALFLFLWTVQPASAFYAPNLQRWVNRDPLGEEGFEVLRGGENSVFGHGVGAINRYQFICNNPINSVDPDGLTGWSLNNPARWWDPNAPDFDPCLPGPDRRDCFILCATGVGTGAVSIGIGSGGIGTVGTGIWGTVVFGYAICSALCGWP